MAIVTGSSRNIGREIAAGIVREGGRVVINARESADELDGTAEELRAAGGDVLSVLADLAVRGAVDRMVAEAIEAYKKIDVLVINHSIRPAKGLLDITDEELDLVLGVNLRATFHLLQAVLPGMVERGAGSVVMLGYPPAGGRAGVVAEPRAHSLASLAAKHAVIRSAMYEFSPHGIRFNWVSPGMTDTLRKHPEWYPDAGGQLQAREDMLRLVPMRRPGQPGEVAAAVLFLASDDASYVNGTMIGADGGFPL
ncbi:MAG TPA: SDR family NAD(P)-dependent oxidoreductase [Baekduia sp.]|nr:SDR family NAD(P)-dependent oxidoreductase [Baekduia sp.]